MSAPPVAARAPAWSMYRAIVGIASACALIIVVVVQVTAPRIRDNRERLLARAIAEVLPAAAETVPVALGDDGALTHAAQVAELPVLLAYDAAGQLAGALIAAEGMGYQDAIRIIYAYSFAQQAIVGFKVLASRETPGLGDRVEHDPQFLANFSRLDVTLNSIGTGLANPVVAVRQGEKTAPWQIDGLTGATISSAAVADIIATSAGDWLPVLERDAASIRRGAGAGEGER